MPRWDVRADPRDAILSPMPEVRHVLTILAVPDLAAARRFYERAFGWPTAVDTAVYVELALPGGQRLGLYDREGFGRNTHQVPAVVATGQLAPVELYFMCEDVEDAMARLAAAGARPLSPLSTRAWGDDAAYFADPDGNVLVVARPARGP